MHNNGMKVLLCEFHLVRIWEEKIKFPFENITESVECLKILKTVQRSQDLIELEAGKE